MGCKLAAFTVASLYLSFPPFVGALGLNGAGIAYSANAALALVTYAWATRGVVTFPWLTLGRILGEMVAAGAVAGWIVQMIGGVTGLLVSGVAYVTVFAALVAVVERPLLRRVINARRRSVECCSAA